MSYLETIRKQFATQVQGPEEGIDLVEAAVLIARTAYPDLDSSHCTRPLNQWAERLGHSLSALSSAGDILSGLNRILFDEQRFEGNHHHYYDPENSFLNRVLERKLGIPITLSLVYSEVGRRAGFPVHGISLPGHFIAGLFHTSGTLYIDPFKRGEILTEAECREMVQVRFGPAAAADESWKHPADKKSILKRMLRNLKGIYRQSDQDRRTFEMIQWILAVDPDAPAELKERGLLYETMGNFAFARRDLEHYLEIAPTATDKEEMEQKIRLLSNSPQRMQ